jgi:hypothetical protein
MTADAFITLAGEHLTSGDAELLARCRLGVQGRDAPPETPSAFINNWLRRERTVALNLAKLRAAKLKREGALEAPAYDPLAETQAKAAAAMESPLEAELFLDKCRWDAVEAATGLGTFGVNKVFAYLLKLRLLERQSLFNTEEGFAEYKAVYAGIMDNAPKAGDSNGEPK